MDGWIDKPKQTKRKEKGKKIKSLRSEEMNPLKTQGIWAGSA